MELFGENKKSLQQNEIIKFQKKKKTREERGKMICRRLLTLQPVVILKFLSPPPKVVKSHASLLFSVLCDATDYYRFINYATFAMTKIKNEFLFRKE